MNASRYGPARVDLPKLHRIGLRSAVIIAIAAAATVVALRNMAQFGEHAWPERGLSILWLCLAAMWLAGSVITAPGIRQWLINGLGLFARRSFVEVITDARDGRTIRHGYMLLNHIFEYQRIALERIEMVDWAAGQASVASGRDLNDWLVGIRLRGDSSEKRHSASSRMRTESMLVSQDHSKDEAAHIGRSIIRLLRDAGLEFKAGEWPNQFEVIPDATGDGVVHSD